MSSLHHYHRAHPRLRGVRGLQSHSLPAGSLTPAQVLTAYGFKQGQYAGAAPVKLGIGSLGGGVVQADIDAAVAAWGMAAPKLAVRTVNGATNDPNSDHDSNVENMLDILLASFTWWWLTGTPADLTICFGPNAGGSMEVVTRDLVKAGVEVASWSWGSAASAWDGLERAALAQAFADAVGANVCFCAASGDNSVDDGTAAPSADYPCSDPNVWAVGGTLLSVNPDGSRAGEAAWGDGQPGDEGGGGGFDPTVAIPIWQRGALPAKSPGRGVPDTAANADPNSGWQISANGSWTVVGGTSAASPFTAALVAVAKGGARAAGTGVAAAAVYGASATACNDITQGSNGDPTAVGWDPATGLGSPRGDGFVQAIAAWARGASPQPPAPVPDPTAPPSLTLSRAIAAVKAQVDAGDDLQDRDQIMQGVTAGLTAVFQPVSS
jgi:kumamolisin